VLLVGEDKKIGAGPLLASSFLRALYSLLRRISVPALVVGNCECLHSFLSAWEPLTSYVSPAPASCHALTWLAGGIWALYSAFAIRVFLVRRGTSIQCQILCVLSSTLLLLHAHPFFLWFFLFLFRLLCGLNAVDERDGLGVARETGWAFRGCLPMGF